MIVFITTGYGQNVIGAISTTSKCIQSVSDPSFVGIVGFSC